MYNRALYRLLYNNVEKAQIFFKVKHLKNSLNLIIIRTMLALALFEC